MSLEEKLEWYFLVERNLKPAKFFICKRIPIEISKKQLKDLDENELWKIHEKTSIEFKKIYKLIKEDKLNLEELEEQKSSYLDLKIELSKRLLNPCRLCERKCLVNRFEESGFCRLKEKTYVSSYFLHLGEEPPLIPSGTIFFCGCNFKCVYCQNWEISQYPENGFLVDAKKLSLIEKKLRENGARNINFVGGNPDQHLHTVIESLTYLDINVPLLWNNNAYSSEECMKILLDLIDIWLPDFKYGNDNCAQRLSYVKNYFQTVTRNIKMMYKNKDPLIIRHLVLPNHLECCTKNVLEWISKNCKNCLVNVMKQYRPEYLVLKEKDTYKEISRNLKKEEIDYAYRLAKTLGINYEIVS